MTLEGLRIGCYQLVLLCSWAHGLGLLIAHHVNVFFYMPGTKWDFLLRSLF